MRKVNNIYTIIMLGLLLAACQNNDKQANDEKMKNETKAEIPAEKEDQKTDKKESEEKVARWTILEEKENSF